MALRRLRGFLRKSPQVLEEFSSSDPALKDAMALIRRKIAAKSYVCAPNFWEDLRGTLTAIERKRLERAAKMKAQQVRIACGEVSFWFFLDLFGLFFGWLARF